MTSFNSTSATVSDLVSTTKEPNLQEPIAASIDSGPVKAYAKLEGDDFCYYIRTLQVSLGRKVTNPNNVDIPLGNTKSVSRQHARLFFNFSTHRFELMVFGKNGAFVNEQFIERGVTVPLDNKTKIQIGEMAFVFLLPRSDTDTVNTTNNASPHNFGYISTPYQLEKKATSSNNNNSVSRTLSQQIENEDYDMSDDSESEPNRYNNKDIKPPYSYASLIAQAINSLKDKRMTLNGIYNYITTNYTYYQMAQNGWQNSIRHNLSLNKAFVKVSRGETEPGKGAFWTIDVNAETQFTNGVYKRNKRNGSITLTENVKKKSKKDHSTTKADSDNSEDENEEELVDEEQPEEEGDDDDGEEKSIEKVPMIEKDDKVKETTQSLLVADPTKIVNTVVKTDNNALVISAKEKEKETIIELVTTAKGPTTTTKNNNTQNAQTQLQLQLQNTIRQHLLDPVRYPLPPPIAQLLPQAIAQLPPQLATQLSSALQTAIKVAGDTTATAPVPESTSHVKEVKKEDTADSIVSIKTEE